MTEVGYVILMKKYHEWLKKRSILYLSGRRKKKGTKKSLRRNFQEQEPWIYYIIQKQTTDGSLIQSNELDTDGEADTSSSGRHLQSVHCIQKDLEIENEDAYSTLDKNIENVLKEMKEREGKKAFCRDRPQSSISELSMLSEEISSKNSSDDYEERLIGTSEDENRHFHSDTSYISISSQSTIDTVYGSSQQISKVDASKETCLDESISLCNEYAEEEIRNSVKVKDNKQEEWFSESSEYKTRRKEKEISESTSEAQNVSHDAGTKENFGSFDKCENNGINWQSSLYMDKHFRRGELSDNYPMLDSSENIYGNSFKEGENGKPVKYSLEYENLNLNILDSASSVTLRLICEKEVKKPTPDTERLKEGRTALSSSESELLIVTEESSDWSSTDDQYVKITENNLTMSASKANEKEMLHPSQKSVEQTNVASKDSLLHEYKSDERSATCDDTDTANQNHESELKDSSETVKSKTNCPDIGDNSETQDKEIVDTKNADDTNFEENVQCTAKSCGDVKQNTQDESLREISENTEAAKNLKLEIDGLVLDYKPTPESPSFEIIYRQHHGNKKLTFKSEEKKLYVRMNSSF